MVPERVSGPADLCRQRQYLGEVAASRGFRGRPIAGPANWELPLTGPVLRFRPRIVVSRHIADAMNFWSIQILNGLSLAMLLFLLSAGLSIIFCFMRVINLAHGAFFFFGGYIGFSIIGATPNFLLALLVAPLAVGVFSAAVHGALLQRVRHNELAQVLLTFGLLLMISDLSVWIWGGLPRTLPRPEFLEGAQRLGSVVFPTYRLAIT